jgi:hypothetical protein
MGCKKARRGKKSQRFIKICGGYADDIPALDAPPAD